MSLQSKVIRICFPAWLAGVRGREVWGAGWGPGVGMFLCGDLFARISPHPPQRLTYLTRWFNHLLSSASPSLLLERLKPWLSWGLGQKKKKNQIPAQHGQAVVSNHQGSAGPGQQRDSAQAASSFFCTKAHWDCLNCSASSCSLRIMCSETFNTISIMQRK